MNLASPSYPSNKRLFCVEDFIGFGERYGIDYHFPRLNDVASQNSPVLHGDVEEMTLSSGISLTHSDVRVLQPYETTSRHSSPLYMLVVLEGCVALTLNGESGTDRLVLNDAGATTAHAYLLTDTSASRTGAAT